MTQLTCVWCCATIWRDKFKVVPRTFILNKVRLDKIILLNTLFKNPLNNYGAQFSVG